MFNKIQNWLRPVDNKPVIDTRPLELEVLNLKVKNEKLKDELAEARSWVGGSIDLIRHQLGSVDLSDIKQGDMSESERKAYCSHISGVYDLIEKDIKKFLHEQLMFMSNNAENWDQVVFGRGTFNGMDLLRNHWKKAREEHIINIKPPEKFDEHEMLPKIDE